MTTPTDPFFALQWHFPLLGDIETVWNEYTGNGVHVVVYDDGVEYTHEDLAANYDGTAPFVFEYDSDGDGTVDTLHDPIPLSANDGHGTSVAGIIAAVDDNGLGGAGVAHGATLTGINFLSDLQFQDFFDVVLPSLEFAQNFDVMNNSWGRTPLFENNQNLNDPTGSRFYFAQAYETVSEDGRGGLGTIIVQAAGNDARNANGDGLNASRHTITVAATDINGDAQSYTNFGPGILLTAPASAVTTDLEGTGGYNDGSQSIGDDNYTETFGGTSAATPTISGVVALMLEANPGLGWRDVQNILALTAAQTGSALDDPDGEGFEVGPWFTDGYRGGASWNGGTMSFHLSYGFGMVDAFAAVRMAEVWLEMFDAAATSANEQQVTADYDEVTNGAIAIPDFDDNTLLPGLATGTVSVAQDIRIETVMVTVDITHTSGSDLEIYLITPDGDRIPLYGGSADATGSILGWGDNADFSGGLEWTFEVTALLGFSSVGDWSIEVYDTWGGDTGTINDFKIDFYGAGDVVTATATETATGPFDIDDRNGGEDGETFVVLNETDDITIASLTVSFTLDSDWDSDLTFFLIGNDGTTQIELGKGTMGGPVTGKDYTFTITDFAGVSSAGLWTLYIVDGFDDAADIVGSVYDISITFEADPVYQSIVDDVHIISRDFLSFTALDSTRSVIRDDNGGTDWLNFVGVNSDGIGDGKVGLNMAKGGKFFVDGVLWGTLQSSSVAFENVVTGDGNDNITGNTLGNRILTGRGNDTVDGGRGKDIIETGVGDDVAQGGVGSDILYLGKGADTGNGGTNADTIYGEEGRDRLFGQGGNDRLFGGQDIDRIFGSFGNDRIFGGDGNDKLFGGTGQDKVFGGEGNDTLDGQNNFDFLYGEGGNDIMTGGSGSDTFVFEAGMDTDRVTDYDIDTDKLRFDDALWMGNPTPPADGTALLALFGSTSGDDVIINFGGGNVVTLTDALLTGTFADLGNDITIF